LKKIGPKLSVAIHWKSTAVDSRSQWRKTKKRSAVGRSGKSFTPMFKALAATLATTHGKTWELAATELQRQIKLKPTYGVKYAMNTLYRSTLGLIGALALTATAFAQVPSTNDTSDTNQNTGMGTGALGGPAATNSGFGNTASGKNVLYYNTTGSYNTAGGAYALFYNSTGYYNTAAGAAALTENDTGFENTASGYAAMYSNTGGSRNEAVGVKALYSNTNGSENTASGYYALFANTSGSDNTAYGTSALDSNTGGNYNNASGYFALYDNTTGSQNSASGVQALFGNKTGNYNTASGTDALFSNTTGSSNIGEGYKAGYNLTTGSNNIDIGNLGMAAESGTIRIGTTSTHTAAYIAGIYGTSVTGSAVVVSSTGQLGVTVSSERFKTDIAPMAPNSEKLRQLRPVTFHLKTDPKGSLQYGLIAEEVAKVYPELVIRNESGRIDGVRYDELAPMLLNEMQQQQRKMETQEKTIASQGAELRMVQQQMSAMRAALTKLQTKEYLAQR
jgi:hypothetical protein